MIVMLNVCREKFSFKSSFYSEQKDFQWNLSEQKIQPRFVIKVILFIVEAPYNKLVRFAAENFSMTV